MHRIQTLPKSFVDWLSAQDTDFIRNQLELRLVPKIEGLGIDSHNIAVLEKELSENERKYHALRESGDTKQFMFHFCTARLISAVKFMRSGQWDDAIYEYFHSFDTGNPEDIIADLQNQ